MYKTLASQTRMILVSRGVSNPTFNFPNIDAEAKKRLYALIHSEPVSFKNLKPLSSLDLNHLPVLPEGHFLYHDGSSWTIRRLLTAPRALLDLDVYSLGGDLDKPAAGYSVSQNKQLVACYVDTAIVEGVKKSRKAEPSTYGGYSSSRKDFKNLETGYSDTIGHAVGHKDSSPGRDKEGGPIYSDKSPRNYSSEKSHATGGSKFGQSIRNHQLEAITRRNKGKYLEWNSYKDTHEQVDIGLYVPRFKLSMRIFGGQSSLAIFDQDKPITKSDTKRVWKDHIVPTSKQPKPLILSDTSAILDEQFSLGPMFLARSDKKLVMQSTDELEIGRALKLDNGDTAIILSKKATPNGFEYEYHAYYQAFHPFVAVYVGMSGVYDRLINEYDALKDGYKERFEPILYEMKRLQEHLDSLVTLSGERKDEALRFITSSLNSGSVSRQTDAKEVLKFVSGELRSIRSHYDELELLVLSHIVQRSDSIRDLMPAFTELIHKLEGDGLSFPKIEEETYRGLAGISNDFKKQDRQLVDTFQIESGHLLRAIRSLSHALQPPKVI